jgi:hypothetical protein
MAELPSGSLTFLCTEMKGRTALCERDHNTMAEVVARHIALLDAAIAALLEGNRRPTGAYGAPCEGSTAGPAR